MVSRPIILWKYEATRKKSRLIAVMAKKPMEETFAAVRIPSSSKIKIELIPLISISTDSSEGIEKIRGLK